MTSTRAAEPLALPALEWPALEVQLDGQGFATTPPLLTSRQCAEVVAMFDDDARFRSTVVMARHAYGEGSHRYFGNPLPPLVPVPGYPRRAAGRVRRGRAAPADTARAALRPGWLQLPAPGRLRRADVPAPARDHAQLGEALLVPVHHRPRLGSRGYRRVQMRHGVSAVHRGDRHVLGIIFHDAT